MVCALCLLCLRSAHSREKVINLLKETERFKSRRRRLIKTWMSNSFKTLNNHLFLLFSHSEKLCNVRPSCLLDFQSKTSHWNNCNATILMLGIQLLVNWEIHLSHQPWQKKRRQEEICIWKIFAEINLNFKRMIHLTRIQ